MSSNPLSQLKEWIVKGDGKNRTTKQMAKNMGIPHRRLKNGLAGKDALTEHQANILTYLVKEGVVQAKDTMNDADPSNDKAHFVPLSTLLMSKAHPDDREHITVIRKRRIAQLADSRVYCQISDNSIGTDECTLIQGGAQCFGCGASSRFCRACQIRFIADSFVDLCSTCLSQDQAAEDAAAQHGIPPVHPFEPVFCHLVTENLLQEKCRTIQTPSCGSCEAPSRLCKACKSRRVYYPEYGLCLSCTITEYSVGTEPCTPLSNDESELIERMKTTQAHAEPPSTVEPKKPPQTERTEPAEVTQIPAPPPQDENDEHRKNRAQKKLVSEPLNAESAESLVTEFASYLTAQEMKTRTIGTYRDYAEKFFSSLIERGLTLGQIQLHTCEEFVLTDEQGQLRGRSDAVVRLSALNKLFNWLTLQHHAELPILNIVPPEQKEKHTSEGPIIAHPKNSEDLTIPSTHMSEAAMKKHYREMIHQAQRDGKNTLAAALTRALACK